MAGRGVTAFLAVFLLVSCTLAAPLGARRDKERLLFGHGGNAAEFPTNTVPSFQSCIDLGCDINEMDVHPTLDDHIVVIHDATVDRTTNGTGAVANMTLAEIRALDAGYWFTTDGGETYPFRGQGIQVPTLAELFSLVPKGRFNIDIKQHTERAARLVAETILANGGADRVIVGSFHDGTVEHFKQYAPGVTTLASTREVLEYTLKYYSGNGHEHVPRSKHIEIPTGFVRDWPSYIETANANGQQVSFWTINDEDKMRDLLLDGADGIITDNVRGAMEVFRDLGYKP